MYMSTLMVKECFFPSSLYEMVILMILMVMRDLQVHVVVDIFLRCISFLIVLDECLKWLINYYRVKISLFFMVMDIQFFKIVHCLS